jgi:hypothetical protein
MLSIFLLVLLGGSSVLSEVYVRADQRSVSEGGGSFSSPEPHSDQREDDGADELHSAADELRVLLKTAREMQEEIAAAAARQEKLIRKLEALSSELQSSAGIMTQFRLFPVYVMYW